MLYSKNDDGTGRYTYTLYESTAQDTSSMWYFKEADRLFKILQTQISGFCEMEEKISIQFYYDHKYDFETRWKCALQFEF
jgi:hypothetical protein